MPRSSRRRCGARPFRLEAMARVLPIYRCEHQGHQHPDACRARRRPGARRGDRRQDLHRGGRKRGARPHVTLLPYVPRSLRRFRRNWVPLRSWCGNSVKVKRNVWRCPWSRCDFKPRARRWNGNIPVALLCPVTRCLNWCVWWNSKHGSLSPTACLLRPLHRQRNPKGAARANSDHQPRMGVHSSTRRVPWATAKVGCSAAVRHE